ncbi:MAG: phytanoyl-CoA dioxygenase family protein [Aliidongia sp.]
MTVAFSQHVPDLPMPLCPLCGAGAGSPSWCHPDGAKAAYACRECGLAYIWPRLAQDFSGVPEHFYYDSFEMLDLAGPGFLLGDITTAIGRRAAHDFAQQSRKPAILDAGCGAGHVLLDFRSHGWDVEGVDPWVAVTDIGRKYYRLPIQTALLEDAAIAPASKDVVLAQDVLQFTAEPKAFLAACLSALRPGGLLYLTIPNFGSAENQRADLSTGAFSSTVYLSYFTVRTIRRLLEESGFYRIQVDSFGGVGQDDHLRVLARRAVATDLCWADVSEDVANADLPPLDRQTVSPAGLTPQQAFWRENGYLVVPGLIADDLIDRYCTVRRQVSHAAGWPNPTPYLDVPEIRELCLNRPLSDMLEHLIGEPVGLHLTLTGWVSTERDWHQDDYLNPPEVNGHYIAAWTALDQIQPDAGPFEFVPGSHRWPIIRQHKVLTQLGRANGDDPDWPWESERLLTPFFEDQIKERGGRIERFLGNRGDVLFWHARLLHRGSLPTRSGAERRSMIAHYTALTHRSDMPVKHRHPGGGWYFVPGAVQPDASSPTSRLQRLIQRLR